MIDYEKIYSKYNLLPKLEKLTVPLFLPTSRINNKYYLNFEYQTYFSHHTKQDAFFNDASDMIENNSSSYCTKYHDNESRFIDLTNLIYEDVVLHTVSKDFDCISAMNVCFPNGWLPDAYIGKSFVELHQHIPNFSFQNHRKMLEGCVNKGPFQRFVWGLSYKNTLNWHPFFGKDQFDIDNPEFFVKIETQIVYGLPPHGFAFILRQNLLDVSDVNLKTLLGTIETMDSNALAYKGITPEFISYLKGKICT